MDRFVLSIVLLLLLGPNSLVIGYPLMPFGSENDGLRIVSLDNANGLSENSVRQRQPTDNANKTKGETRTLDNNWWIEKMLFDGPSKKEFNYNVRELNNRASLFDLFDSFNSLLDSLRSDRSRQFPAPMSSSSWPMFKRQLIRPRYIKKHRDILRGLALKRSDQSANIESDLN